MTSFFVPVLLFSILKPLFLPPSSISLSYFILAVPMRRKALLHESPFHIAILNGTFFFRSVKAMNNWKQSAIKQILLLLLFPCCYSVYFCCSHELCHCVRCPLWYICLCRFCILTGLYEIVTCVLSFACLLTYQLTLICPKSILLLIIWACCDVLCWTWCWSFLCISPQLINK